VNFTREPIIETVITPREGCKLVVRNSKGSSQEDYFVDALEVVSFGHSFFFRSQERPKSFLVPVSDYEILEAKEPRMVIKNPSAESSIKIGGGKEAAQPRQPKEQEDPLLADSRPAPERTQAQERKRDRRRRGRRGRDRHQEQRNPEMQSDASELKSQESLPQYSETPVQHLHDEHGELAAPVMEPQEEVKAPSFISKLFPPPSTLIKETLSRYKPVEEEIPSESELFDHPTKDELIDDNEE
jgi:hypothetical protein